MIAENCKDDVVLEKKEYSLLNKRVSGIDEVHLYILDSTPPSHDNFVEVAELASSRQDSRGGILSLGTHIKMTRELRVLKKTHADG